jgi:hypothetical protein
LDIKLKIILEVKVKAKEEASIIFEYYHNTIAPQQEQATQLRLTTQVRFHLLGGKPSN